MDVVSVSSGVGSAFTWKLALDENQAAQAVFADVNGEHPDNYRFLAEVEAALGAPLVRLDNDGKTIWDVMCEGRFLANTRVDICSRVLKRETIQRWLAANASGSTVWLGFDWTEAHRFEGTSRGRGHREAYEQAGYGARAPMIEKTLDRADVNRWLAEIGVEAPLLTRLGFSHANCGGGCVKAGAKQFKRLLRLLPDWYAWWEEGEERVRRHLDRDDIAILRRRTTIGHERVQVEVSDGVWDTIVKPIVRTDPMTLRQLREAVETDPQGSLFDDDDRDACGCFSLFDSAA